MDFVYSYGHTCCCSHACLGKDVIRSRHLGLHNGRKECESFWGRAKSGPPRISVASRSEMVILPVKAGGLGQVAFAAGGGIAAAFAAGGKGAFAAAGGIPAAAGPGCWKGLPDTAQSADGWKGFASGGVPLGRARLA